MIAPLLGSTGISGILMFISLVLNKVQYFLRLLAICTSLMKLKISTYFFFAGEKLQFLCKY